MSRRGSQGKNAFYSDSQNESPTSSDFDPSPILITDQLIRLTRIAKDARFFYREEKGRDQ